jgi:antitoxin MazE
MRIEIKKWGNSLALRIPDMFAKELGVSEGTPADLRIENGKLVLEPISPFPKYRLEDLVASITDVNRHEEVDWGAGVEKEAL